MTEHFAVVNHVRWSDDDVPRATVIRSTDGWRWHDMGVTDPDSASEIAEALECLSELRALREAGDDIVNAVALLSCAGQPEDMDLLLRSVQAWNEARRD